MELFLLVLSKRNHDQGQTMRITNQLTNYHSISSVQQAMSNFYKVSNQVSTGLQIQNSFESANTYIDNTRLEYELKTLEQVEKAASLANEMTKNTDKALGDIVSLIEQFKVKVTQAASDSQTQTSREAIAKELTRIKEEIVNIANTSVNGQFLFSGSLSGTKPFDQSGNYYGDNKSMNIVTGDSTQSAYNVSGYDLFYKADNDFKKQITTNVSFTDNRYDLNQNPDKTTYLDGNAAIRNLIGLGYVRENNPPLDPTTDFETTPKDFPPTALYVQGTRPDGTSFKSAVLMQPGDTLQGMLDKIGALYGNTDTNKVVDISINNSGQIQITDLKQGNNTLDFHAVAFTPQVQNSTELDRINEDLQAQGNSLTDLTNIVMQQALGANGDLTNLTSPVNIGINGNNYSISLQQTDFIFSKMTDTLGNATNGADYDNVFFETSGNKVIGNISQITKADGVYATASTKLSEVATGDLANTTLNLVVNSKGGNTYNVTIDLGNSSVSYEDPANPGQNITFPIMHTNPATSNNGVVTPSNDITYKQLNDVIGLFASDQMPTATIPVNANQVTAADFQTYNTALQNSKSTVEVSLDYKGRITITDKLSTGTNIGVAMHDSQSTQFPALPLTTTAQVTDGAALSFSANNALIIDEPHVDLIKDLELMIDSVLEGNMRADSEGKDPRNTGMQGALERLDHLGEHLRKQRTQIGASAKAIEDTESRVKLLKVNIQSVKSEVIDTDLAEALTQMMQTQLTYQAAMKASTTLSQLSLLNYM